MGSRRMLKHKINTVVNNIIEECYSIQMSRKNGKEGEITKIIDEAVEGYNRLLERMNAARTISDRNVLRKHYEAINTDLEKLSLTIMGKMNKIN